MKKLLLITFLFLITPDAKADMDYVCRPNGDEREFIQENCERNNILLMSLISNEQTIITNIALWCRKDREINYALQSYGYDLTCVLYDNKPRQIIPQ